MFPIFAWTRWSSRNKTTMEGTPFDGTYILKRAKSLTVEFFCHHSDMSTSIRKELVLIGWTPPPFSSYMAELWGLRDGLLLARHLNVSKIIMEIDAKSIVDILNNENDHVLQSHPCSTILSDCRSFI